MPDDLRVCHVSIVTKLSLGLKRTEAFSLIFNMMAGIAKLLSQLDPQQVLRDIAIASSFRMRWLCTKQPNITLCPSLDG